jgi:hypothetical protein
LRDSTISCPARHALRVSGSSSTSCTLNIYQR